MKKSILFLLLIVALVVMFSASAKAVGIGVYFNGGGGKTTWELIRTQKMEYFIGGGFVLDTCVARDAVFNYRLNLGYDHNIPKEIIKLNIQPVKVDFYRLNLINTFGFGIVRHNIVRFWLGPQICVRYLNAEITQQSYVIALLLRSPLLTLFPMKAQQARLQADLGIATGLNFHLGELISLAVEGGFRYGLIFGTSNTQQSGSSVTITLIGNPTYEAYGSIGILFRFNDSYASPAIKEEKRKVEIQ